MLDYLLENFDSIDLNQPRFYSRPCTRCLRCKGTRLTLKQRGDANFFYCSSCAGPVFQAVGVGMKHQVTREISWLERHEIADEIGTPLSFSPVKPESPLYLLYSSGGFRDEPDPFVLFSFDSPMRAEYEDADFEVEFEFTTLASAILYAVKEVKRGFYSFDGKLNGNPLTHHEIMEAFAQA